MGKRVGIMGGTFNPVHYGHLRLALTAQEQVLLDKVLFMPSGKSYMKNNVLETHKRVDMVALAIEEYPQFELSLIEANKRGNTYTVETLQDLAKSTPDTKYFFILNISISLKNFSEKESENEEMSLLVIKALMNTLEIKTSEEGLNIQMSKKHVSTFFGV